MVQVAEKKDIDELSQKFEFLERQIKSLEVIVSNQFLNSREAMKLSATTGQRFYNFIRDYEIRSIGLGKSIRYSKSEIEYVMRNRRK